MQGQRWIMVADSPFLPPSGGGKREHFGFARAAADAGLLSQIVVPAEGDFDAAPYQREFGVPVISTPRRMSPFLLAHPGLPFIVASRPAPDWLPERVRALSPDANGIVVFSHKSHAIGEALARRLHLPAVLRQHNRESAYHRSLAAGTPGPRGLVLRWEAMRIARDERRVSRADWLTGTADISAADAAWRQSTGARNVIHVPPFALVAGGQNDHQGDHRDHDERVDAQRSGPPRIIFVGALDIATNLSALDWMLRSVWPMITAAHPDVVLDVVGSSPADALRRRIGGMERVVLHADVPTVRPYLSAASVAVNPAITGSGVNIKVVEYLDAGVPLVSTSLATRGLPLRAGRDLEVHDDPAGFAAAVLRLLAEPEAAGVMAKNGQQHVRELLDPHTNLGLIARLLSERR